MSLDKFELQEFLIGNNFNFNQPLLEWYDFAYLPFTILLVFGGAYIFGHFFAAPAKENKYFFLGLIAKIIGAISITLIYNYYYRGGDTNAYFNDGRLLSNLMFHNPRLGIEAFLVSDIDHASNGLKAYLEHFRFASASDTWITVKFSAISQAFSLGTYLNSAILFAFFSYLPAWLLYKKFCQLVPGLINGFAVAFLFLPSLLNWGSAIFKDTITFAGLALLFVTAHNVLVEKKFGLFNILFLFLSGYVIYSIKDYIIISFLAVFLIYIYRTRVGAIQDPQKRLLAGPVFGILFTFMLVAVGWRLGGLFEQTVLAPFLFKLETLQEYLSDSGRSVGSAYDIGNFEPNLGSFLTKVPASISFTLYRPFIWESSNLVMLLAALESSFILLLTIYALFRQKILGFFVIILNDKLVFFCILFTILFAIPIGIASGNYGTLVRYKIPCLPFYVAAMYMIINYRNTATATATARA